VTHAVTLSRAIPQEETCSVRASPADVASLDDWIASIARKWGESERTMFAVRLCVAELAANVVEHGLAGADGRITVTLSRDGADIAIAFTDTGSPFDPTGATSALPVAPNTGSTAPETAVSGRGLGIVRAYAKNLTYRRDGHTNRVMLKISGRPQP